MAAWNLGGNPWGWRQRHTLGGEQVMQCVANGGIWSGNLGEVCDCTVNQAGGEERSGLGGGWGMKDAAGSRQ